MKAAKSRKFNWERAEARLRRAISDLHKVRLDIWDNSDSSSFDISIGGACSHLETIADQMHALKVRA